MKRELTLIVTLLCTLLVTGCGAGAPKLEVKAGGKASTMNVKSGGTYYGNIINTSPGKPNVQTFAHTVRLANYDLDLSNMRKALTTPDQMRVDFQLTGDEGTKDDSPFKVGTYTVKPDGLNKLRWLSLVTFADGKEVETPFDTVGSTPKATGEVKITAVTADSISGELNLTDGDKSIKGTFTAMLPQKT